MPDVPKRVPIDWKHFDLVTLQEFKELYEHIMDGTPQASISYEMAYERWSEIQRILDEYT